MFDLRAVGEGDDGVTVWGDGGGPEVVRAPLLEHQRLYDPDALVKMSTDADYARRFMLDIYAEFPDALRKLFLPEMARRLGGQQQSPVLVHCAGGQDRTGVAVAVVLLALGVSREDVVADYVRTAEFWDLDRLMGLMQGLIGSKVEADQGAVEYLLARPEYIEAAIDRLLAEHGSIEAYWASAGVDTTALDRLRSVLLL